MNMNVIKATTALGLIVAAAAAGCKSSTSEPSTAPAPAGAAEMKAASETTMAPLSAGATPPPEAPAAAASAAPAVATPALADKDMTHVLAKDEAYFSSAPMSGRKPDGTLKAGTRVVVMMPRGSYSQVMTADGKRVYTTTAALKPVGS